MKRSDKILFGLGLSVFVMVFLMLLTARYWVNMENGISEIVTIETRWQHYTGEPFSEITTAGSWDLEIEQGETFSVTLKGDDAKENRAVASIDGNVLVLAPSNRAINLRDAKAIITVPALGGLTTSGVAKGYIGGFSASEFSVVSAGAADLKVKNSTFENFRVSLSGASEISFDRSVTRNADIKMAGACKVSLTMNGGLLSGSAAGVGEVNIEGDIGANTLQSAGVVKVNFR